MIESETEPTSSCSPQLLVGACFWITTRCNLNCDVCYADLYSEADNTPSGYMALVDQLYRFGFNKIAFTGGDPLLVKSLPEVLEYAKSLAFKTAVTTNGKLLNKSLFDRLAPWLDELTLPVDGADESTSWMHRTSAHRHQHVLETLSTANFHEVAVDVSTVVTRFNVDQLPTIGQMLMALGVGKWKVFEYSALNKRSDVETDFSLNAGVFEAALNGVRALAEGHGWPIEIDARAADQPAINSYINLLPRGTVLVGAGEGYINLGSLLAFEDRQDLIEKLTSTGFSFEHHARRHHRDFTRVDWPVTVGGR